MKHCNIALYILLSAQIVCTQTLAHSSYVSECFTIHGKLFQANGVPDLRIWKTGTKRILGVFDCNYRDESDQALPENVKKLVGPTVAKPVFGNFEVCPFTKERSGWMQMVCIKKVSHLIVANGE